MGIKSMVTMPVISSSGIIDTNNNETGNSRNNSHLVSMFFALILFTGISDASTILGATSVTTDGGERHAISNIIDQSGLSASYISGVTNFDSYVSSAPTHISNFTNTIWASDFTTSGVIDFGFAGPVTLDTLALWSRDGSYGSLFGIKDFSLFMSDSADFSLATHLGNYTAVQNAGGNDSATLVQTFSFGATSGSFLRLQYHNNYGEVLVEIGEIAFKSTVPVPAAVWLFGSGLLGLIGVARRKKA